MWGWHTMGGVNQCSSKLGLSAMFEHAREHIQCGSIMIWAFFYAK